MIQKRDNYKIQVAEAKKRFLTYDQQELIRRCHLAFDQQYLYARLLSSCYRICRTTGDMQRLQGEAWVDGNGFGEVMTLFDWLCDSRADRCTTGRWVNITTLGHSFHRQLQEARDPDAELFDRDPEGFARACRALGAEEAQGGDVAFTVELIDDLRVLLQLWHSDDEFPAKLCVMWDENALQYIRYETTWYAVGLLMQRLRENR